MRNSAALLCAMVIGCQSFGIGRPNCDCVTAYIAVGEVWLPERVPVILVDDTLDELLSLMPAGSNQYDAYCTYQLADQAIELVPRVKFYKESFRFERKDTGWFFLDRYEIFWFD
jgi:hypothetical protein